MQRERPTSPSATPSRGTGRGAIASVLAVAIAASISLAPLSAAAQYAQPAPPPSPSQPQYAPPPQYPPPPQYAPPQPQYVTPLYQTTQPTYVPQSVAMSGPRTIRDWEDGDPIPAGYRPIHRMRKGLVIGGAVTFGSLYFLTALSAAAASDVARASGTRSNAGALYVPGIGPFLYMSESNSSTGNVFLAIDGLGQCAGLAMLIAGLTVPKTILVRADLGGVTVAPTTMALRGGGGLGVVGMF